MSHDDFSLCMQWMEQSCGAGRGREVEMACFQPRRAEVTSMWRQPGGQL